MKHSSQNNQDLSRHTFRLDRRVTIQVPCNEVRRLGEHRRREVATGFLMLLQNIGQPQLGRFPRVGLETFTNDLAASSNSAIVIAVADAL
jgi:hypothetical protein